ncbi:hypothetical protein BO70DRAFT_363677 [Aspergillus heteromorphus CBS 117.55]|uniref:Uncharacterized protein n=1 Tax=Aspergillus heteromorphus CBS 117.55 TaxID=1448321 RepID=A0A317VUU9_9EURO|nr:uncharacterized protein BO70DRAFT_363677 [Aspergillus heteromorphus CBS 117.55]PWY77121.1 hypothetical protein BO70DRAFT_363677 [Aspergillus heteromorphus CBS 117.55]
MQRAGEKKKPAGFIVAWAREESQPTNKDDTSPNTIACDGNKDHVSLQARRMQQSSGPRVLGGWVGSDVDVDVSTVCCSSVRYLYRGYLYYVVTAARETTERLLFR